MLWHSRASPRPSARGSVAPQDLPHEEARGLPFLGVTKQLGDRKLSFGTTILSEVELNAYFEMLGLPKVRLIDARVTSLDGTHQDVAPLDRILLRPEGAIGKLRYHNPLEINDPVPTKTYVQRPNGLFVSTTRTDEGRFVEFGCEWVPEITMPEHLVSVDISGLQA